MSKTQIATILEALIFSIAAFAKAPGGIEGYALWGSPANVATEGGKGVSLFCVQEPDSATEVVYCNIGDKKNDIVLTNKRMANVGTFFYTNYHAENLKKKQICSYFNGNIVGDSVRFVFNAKKENIPASKVGKNSEVVVYGKMLKPYERRKVETYLAIKHSVTLQGSYVSASDATVWDRNRHLSFSNNIVGLAREDKSELNKDSLHNDNISMRSVRKLEDGQFLLIGDNGGRPRFKGSEDSSCAVLQKEWLSQVSGGDFISDVRLDINSIEVFFDEKELSSIRLQVNDTLYDQSAVGKFSNVRFPNGDNKIKIVADKSVLSKKDDNNNLFSHVELYPNPTTDGRVRVRIQLSEAMPLEMKLSDMAGRILSEASYSEDSFFDVVCNVPGAGKYILLLLSKNQTYTINILSK